MTLVAEVSPGQVDQLSCYSIILSMTWDRKSQFPLQISLGLWCLSFHRQVIVTELNVELFCPLLNL